MEPEVAPRRRRLWLAEGSGPVCGVCHRANGPEDGRRGVERAVMRGRGEGARRRRVRDLGRATGSDELGGNTRALLSGSPESDVMKRASNQAGRTRSVVSTRSMYHDVEQSIDCLLNITVSAVLHWRRKMSTRVRA